MNLSEKRDDISMDIYEAIAHCKEVATSLEHKAITGYTAHQASEQADCVQCANDHKQLAEWLEDYVAMKDLLRQAVHDFDIIGAVENAPIPAIHPDRREYIRIIDVLDHRWRYTEQALKLIGSDTHEINKP